eukprot:1227257-Pyramimonas_sp.AAC.1
MARRRKSVKNQCNMNDVGLVGLSWAASWKPSGRDLREKKTNSKKRMPTARMTLVPALSV